MSKKEDTHVLPTLRAMTWDCIRKELYFMLGTFWSDNDNFENVSKVVNKFISTVESEGWIK